MTRGRAWTEADTVILKDRANQRWTNEQIAKDLGFDQSAVRRRRKWLDLPASRPDVTPSAALDAVILIMIAQHVGKPCPTRQDVTEWTGLPRRKVWLYLESMRARGVIELEIIESREAGRDPKRRRMRSPSGEWTDWTQRATRESMLLAWADKGKRRYAWLRRTMEMAG